MLINDVLYIYIYMKVHIYLFSETKNSVSFIFTNCITILVLQRVCWWWGWENIIWTMCMGALKHTHTYTHTHMYDGWSHICGNVSCHYIKAFYYVSACVRACVRACACTLAFTGGVCMRASWVSYQQMQPFERYLWLPEKYKHTLNVSFVG